MVVCVYDKHFTKASNEWLCVSFIMSSNIPFVSSFFVLSYYVSLRYVFRVVMSITISA